MFISPDYAADLALIEGIKGDNPDDPPCGAVDPLTGAVCQRPKHSDGGYENRHRDDSDPGIEFRWH